MSSITPDRFEKTTGLNIVGISRLYSPGTEGEIPALWEKFIPLIESIPHHIPNITFGLCLSFHPVGGFEYLAGVEVTEVGTLSPELRAVSLPPRQYAVFIHEGHYSLLPQTFAAICTGWQNLDGEAPSFERYTEEYNPETGSGGIEVWIPLLKQLES